MQHSATVHPAEDAKVCRLFETSGGASVSRPLYQVKAEFFKTLGHPARIRVLELLSERDHSVAEMLSDVGIEATSLSQQLAVLRRSGLVETRRDGLWIHYRLGRLSDPVMATVLEGVRHALAHVDRIHADGGRLQKRTGCCLPKPTDVLSQPCCSATGRR